MIATAATFSSRPPPGSAAASPGLADPPGWRRWLLAARPRTLPAAAAPVLVGTACASAVDAFRAGPAVAALAGALLLQIGANFANDVFDFERGADTPDRLGPTRAVQSGLLEARALRVATAVVFALALAIGVYLTAVAGWPVVAIGVTSILAALAYTGGPYPLGYNGLGDAAVFVFFGLVAVCGTAYVQALAVPAVAWWAAVPVGALSTAILVVNNVRDLRTDERAGKRTLAVRLGRDGAVAEYALLLVTAYAAPPLLVFMGLLGAWALLPMLTLPLAAGLLSRVAREHGRPLNTALADTALLLFLHAALFALGIVLGA